MTNIEEPQHVTGTTARLPLVVIIGGGFAGLSAARALARAPVRVLLLDRTNHHLFQPLLYQVAIAQLSPAEIAKPIRSILRDQKNATVSMSDVQEIHPDTREIVTTDRRIVYDHLIVAGGARHSYFGKEAWEAHAPGLKSLGDAIEVRRRVLTAFEQAETYGDDEPHRRSAMTLVVVGAGPTGVELAGAIAELAHNTLKADFRAIDPKLARVLLVEAGPSVLPTYSDKLSASARAQLETLHVEVRLNTRVTGVSDSHVELDGERVNAHTIIWAAGNVASPLGRQIGAVDGAGRILVNQDLTVPRYPEIHAVGDMVTVNDRRERPVPGVAPAAMQMGRHAARNIELQLAGKAPRPFWYVDKGSLSTIGRHAGIADIKGLQFGGFLAWLTWALIHLVFLVGFRNRTLVVLQWAWAYVFYTRGARLITDVSSRR